jgi:hypothetical protein
LIPFVLGSSRQNRPDLVGAPTYKTPAIGNITTFGHFANLGTQARNHGRAWLQNSIILFASNIGIKASFPS